MENADKNENLIVGIFSLCVAAALLVWGFVLLWGIEPATAFYDDTSLMALTFFVGSVGFSVVAGFSLYQFVKMEREG